jgi:hypothetical protein
MKTEEIMKQEELSDEQLDNVAGGVSPGISGLDWRKTNEGEHTV